jgi:hypothetical protein
MFTEKDLIRDMLEAVFHVLSQFGYQVNAVYEKLFKESLRADSTSGITDGGMTWEM